jgi:broad specificity phosphatase PhoE
MIVKDKKLYFILFVVLLIITKLPRSQGSISRISKIFQRKSKEVLFCATILCTFSSSIVNAGMLTFPLNYPLKNNIVLIRAGESFADARHEVQTNPVKKLRQDNALTAKGREQIIETAKQLELAGYQPSFIWVSNTERAYESAAVLARQIQLGQNRIVPEFSFLDARAVGIYEGKNDQQTWQEIHEKDEKDGINYRPPVNTDGTPSDSVATVLVRINQLVSSIESMYSGENVAIVSPDSEVLSVLEAVLSSDNPDNALRHHFQHSFRNGEARFLQPYIQPPTLLASGQTQNEADANSRAIKVALIGGESGRPHLGDKDVVSDWYGLYKLSVDHSL